MTAVLDASAVLALLYDEPDADTVADYIAGGAVISAVNLSEVATILIRHGRDPHAVLAPLHAQIEVVPFADADALTAAQLYPHVSSKGVSLGDRACLALAQRLTAPAVTAEHIWADTDLDIPILGIRPPQT